MSGLADLCDAANAIKRRGMYPDDVFNKAFDARKLEVNLLDILNTGNVPAELRTGKFGGKRVACVHDWLREDLSKKEYTLGGIVRAQYVNHMCPFYVSPCDAIYIGKVVTVLEEGITVCNGFLKTKYGTTEDGILRGIEEHITGSTDLLLFDYIGGGYNFNKTRSKIELTEDFTTKVCSFNSDKYLFGDSVHKLLNMADAGSRELSGSVSLDDAANLM